MNTLNDRIAEDPNLGPQFRIGPATLPRLPLSVRRMAKRQNGTRGVAEAEIAPLLREYWFDDPDIANPEKEKLLNSLG